MATKGIITVVGATGVQGLCLGLLLVVCGSKVFQVVEW